MANAKIKQVAVGELVIDDITHVREELARYGGRTKQMGNNLHVLCPFHDERTPSCSINMSRESDVGIGTFFCFGCGEKGNWNRFAEKTGLLPLKSWQSFESNTDALAARAKKKQIEFLGVNNNSIQRLLDEVGNEAIPWPIDKDWRSYSGKLLSRIGAWCYNDTRQDELMLVLPVYINDKYRGGVRAYFEKQENGLSYLTTNGDWVRSYGLLGYDYMVKRDLWGCKSIVLVEGPRDWLRLIKNKIPACGILGSNMFSAKKLALLQGLGIRKIFAMPDNDTAGKKMHALVKAHCADAGIAYDYLKLPRKKDKEGKLIKLDPDNCSQTIIDQVKKMVYAVK